MKIQGGFGQVLGMQGGCGCPPLIVKISNKWYRVEDSHKHGGTICYQCSESRQVPYGFTPQRFGQPKPYGSECYRSLIPQLKPAKHPFPKLTIPWGELVDLIKKQFGEPIVIPRKEEQK